MSVFHDFHKSKKKKWDNVYVMLFSIIFFLLGVIILVYLHCYEGDLEIESKAVFNSLKSIDQNYLACITAKQNTFKNIYQPIFYNVGTIMIVIAIGTLLFELFGYLSYFRKRIAEVFTENEIVDLLTDEYKKELKFNITRSIYNPDTEDSRELLQLFDRKLSNIMETYYYKQNEIHIECSIITINKNKYIKKEITKTIKLGEVNSTQKNFYEEFINFSCKSINEKDTEPFKLNWVMVNGVKTNEYKQNETKGDESPYKLNYSYSFNHKLEIINNLTISVNYTSVVPINDRMYSIKVDKLCKSMISKICFKENEMEVMANGFKFTTSNGSKFICKHHRMLTEANSNGWVLPGEGLVFLIFTK